MEELEKGPKELKGFASPQEEQQYELKYPQSSQGLNHQPKSTHGRTPSCICSRGWPNWSSMRGEALGSVKALCSSIGECQGREVGVGGLVSSGRVEEIGVFEGETRKGDNI